MESLMDAGVKIRAYDPAAMEETRHLLKDKIYYASDIYDAAQGTDAVIVPTEWKEFRIPNWAKLKDVMKNHLVIDGRNIYNKEELSAQGFEYSGIGQ